MDKETVRIEVLKIAFSHSRTIEETVRIAKGLENYVLNNSPEKADREVEKVDLKKPTPSNGKKVVNPDILS